MIKANQKYFNRILVVIDGAFIFASLVLAWLIRFKSGLLPIAGDYLGFWEYLKPTVVIVPLYLIIYYYFKLYMPQRFKQGSDELKNILKANGTGILAFILLLYLYKIVDYSRYLLILFSVISCVSTAAARMTIRRILRRIRSKGFNLKHIVIAGLSDSTVEFLDRLKANRQWGYHLIGFFDDGKASSKKIFEAGFSAGVKRLGSLKDMKDSLAVMDVDEVFITLDMKDYESLGDIIEACEKNGIRTSIVPGYYKYIPARPYLEEIDGLPIINIRYVPLDHVINRSMKRSVDILGAILALILFSPVMLITAVSIKLTSKGPVLFRQERVGLNRKSFHMLKFRSMKLQQEQDEKGMWTTAGDPRRTGVGNFIRKTSIDELPQLINVLKGDMSLVGPRPERPHFVEQFKEEIPRYMIKHQVRPGMTGWAQVNGWRGDTSIIKRIECDLYYIENWDMLFDVRILILTVFKGFVNKNAY